METERGLNDKILKITMTIQEEYPELSKYLEEMPDTITNENNSGINIKNLREYYYSLNSLVKNYAREHINSAK